MATTFHKSGNVKLKEISRELATYADPLGERAGRVGLVESDPPTSPTKAKLVVS